MGTKKRMLFISHSSYDRDYVSKIVDLLRKQGIGKDQLFCSSYPGYGIPGGKSIFEFLRDMFTDYELYVLFAISKENYYASPACLNEMGAAWVLGVRSVAILLPGTSVSDLRGAIGQDYLSIVLDSEEAKYRLSELKEDILDYLGLAVDSQAAWECDRDSFLEECRSISMKKRNAYLPGVDIDTYLDDLTEGRVPISRSLKRALTVAKRSGDTDAELWISKELTGYEISDQLPEYRQVKSNSFRYSGISGTMQVNNAMLPLNYLDEETLELVVESGISDAMESVEHMLSDGGNVSRDLSALIPIVLHNTDGFCQCTSIVQIIPTTSVRKIVVSVENRLMVYFLMKLA